MPKTYRYSWIRRLVNGLMEPAVKVGLAPSNMWLLSVTGRKSGKTYTKPVNIVMRGGERYLVSPYGERDWVMNARASGEVALSRGRRRETHRIVELAAAEAGPVLRDYWGQNPLTRSFFDAGRDAPDEAFAAEAARHPVFQVV